jgi:hypothetical protein
MYASYQSLLPHTRSAQARVHPLSTSGNTELVCAHCALSTLPTYNSLVWLVHPGQNEKVRPRRRGGCLDRTMMLPTDTNTQAFKRC